MLAILAPGQGAQSAGFLGPWLEHPPYGARLRALVEAAGAVAVAELLHALPRSSPAELSPRMRDTALLQPLLVSVGIAAAGLLPDSVPRATALAGHSVGGLTTTALAGVLAPAEAVALAAARGEAMAAAAALEPTGMTAVVGSPAALAAVAGQWGSRGLSVATHNGSRQLVLAGRVAALEALEDSPLPGVRTARLEVAGAFHTEHMQPAVPPLRAAVAGLEASDPARPVVSDLDGALLHSGAELLNRLPRQLVRPVRWDRCRHRLEALGVTGVLELPPAGTLSALARRDLPGVETFTLDAPDRLEPARRFVERHG